MAQAQLNLATALHSLNNLRPDGGSRLQVWGALAALLLDAGQPAAALHELDLALEALLTAAVPVEAHASVALPLAFNRAKALAALGRLREADRAYEQVMAQAHGQDLSTYAKAVAAAEELSSSRLNQVAALMPQALAVLRASPRQQQGELQDGEERLPASQGQGGWLAGISSMEAAWLGFGLFKALDRVGDVAGAWSALTAANQQAAAAQPYSPDPDWRTLATLTRAFKGQLKATVTAGQEGA
ncbi:uncharacterized protein HaLaN_08583 [Haematococcus lacustris]|uniref:TPR_REGION domain-containing protein n=1 Tax=Haematococcus lacustris TaxID=44745 RepID=A0A699YUB2_HAELA|nr:uncharacterized protein HaLaN_08583 [Haematococcus lacustris]